MLGVDVDDYIDEDEDVRLAVAYLEGLDIQAEVVDLLAVHDSRMNYRPGVRLEVVPVHSLAYRDLRSQPTYRLRIDVNSKTGTIALFSFSDEYEDCRLIQYHPQALRSDNSSRLIQDSMGSEGDGDIIISFEECEPDVVFLLLTIHYEDSDVGSEHLTDMIGHTLESHVDGTYPGDMSVSHIADIVRVMRDSGLQVEMTGHCVPEWETLLEFWEDNAHIIS
jgi:hypothetical protein